jgi:cation-transporting P-type ATPase 13A2
VTEADSTLTTGLLMLSVVGLSAFNLLVLLVPPGPLQNLLELLPLPASARTTLLATVVINVVLSLAFERWGTQGVAAGLSWAFSHLRRERRRIRDGKAYKAVEP